MQVLQPRLTPILAMAFVLQLLGSLVPVRAEVSSFCEESEESAFFEIFASPKKTPEKTPIEVKTRDIKDEEFTDGLILRLQKFAEKYPAGFFDELKTHFLITNWEAKELGALKRGQLQMNEIKLKDFEKKNPLLTELVFHHELSHFIFIRFAQESRKDTMIKAYYDWRDQHRSSVRTYQEDSPVPGEKKGQWGVSEDLLKRGFLNDYGMRDLHEDFAVYAEALFTGKLRNGDSFWDAYRGHQAIRDKTAIVVSVYQEANSQFSLQYFEKLSAPDS
jgi:hypothetical protein